MESIPNKGVYVKGFSPRDIDDMFEIRKELEALAIKMAIARMDEIHLAKIKDVFDLMEFYTAKKDQAKVDELNILYHETIYQATQSNYFEQLLKDIHYYVSVTSRHCLKDVSRMDTALEEHRAILEMIEDQDEDEAAALVRRHIAKTQMLVRKYYAKERDH